jgi:hypothetical protein
MLGTIPPAGVVPMHSHADPETFHVLVGAVEGLVVTADGHRWVPVRPGDVYHVPGGAPHAWRNPSRDVPARMHIVTTGRMGRFFRDVGRPLSEAGEPPSEVDLRRFAETAERYGYWNASPQENAAVDITPPEAPA